MFYLVLYCEYVNIQSPFSKERVMLYQWSRNIYKDTITYFSALGYIFFASINAHKAGLFAKTPPSTRENFLPSDRGDILAGLKNVGAADVALATSFI